MAKDKRTTFPPEFTMHAAQSIQHVLSSADPHHFSQSIHGFKVSQILWNCVSLLNFLPKLLQHILDCCRCFFCCCCGTFALYFTHQMLSSSSNSPLQFPPQSPINVKCSTTVAKRLTLLFCSLSQSGWVESSSRWSQGLLISQFGCALSHYLSLSHSPSLYHSLHPKLWAPCCQQDEKCLSLRATCLSRHSSL